MKRTAVALVDEARCIGCARCIEACPVDAIAGAQGLMHTVIAAYCTGCELCLPPCPVDCIDMVPAPGRWIEADAKGAKRRASMRKERMSRQAPKATVSDRRAVIAAALKRKGRS
ncbi:MAG: RnfABCDGE type electron transport complex subunit B [Pseudomonadota bacterium]